MATPLLVTAQLDDPSPLPVGALPYQRSALAAYEECASLQLRLSGSGTQTVHLGTLEGNTIVALFVEQDPSEVGDPISLVLNHATAGALTIPPGGFVLWSLSDSPQTTPTLEITHTTDAIVRVRAYG